MTPKITEHGDCLVWHPKNGEEGYSISFVGGGWMPGSYDSIESALKGFDCCIIDESRFVTEIQQPINHFNKGDRLITVSDMKEFN